MTAGTDQVNQRIAANIRRYRKARRLSQEELAFQAGIHRTQISLLEKGDRTPRLITFIKLRGALGVTADDLLDGIVFEPYESPTGGFKIASIEDQQ